MAQRLVVGSVVVAGLAAAATWSGAPVAAFEARPPVAPQVQPPTVKEANKGPVARPILEEGTARVEEDLLENGVIRTVLVIRDAKTLRERYAWYHQQIAEKLTVEQLAEKCNALKRESTGLSPEGEIEQIQKNLDELKRKHDADKGISSRIQGAMEALGPSPPSAARKPNNFPQYGPNPSEEKDGSRRKSLRRVASFDRC